jgi:hypothetical protein
LYFERKIKLDQLKTVHRRMDIHLLIKYAAIVLILLFGLISITITTSIVNASAADLRDPSQIMKSGNGTNQIVVGPPKIIKSKPTGNYSNYINGTYISIGPPKAIKSKPTGNYSNYINGTYISIGPPKAIKSKPTGNYSNYINGTYISIGPPKTPQQEPINQNSGNRGFQMNRGASTTGQIPNNAGNKEIPSKPITKEEAQKAEEKANAMLKNYNQKTNQQARAAGTPAATTATTTMTTTNSSQQQQQDQQPLTPENTTGGTASEPTGIPGIP